MVETRRVSSALRRVGAGWPEWRKWGGSWLAGGVGGAAGGGGVAEELGGEGAGGAVAGALGMGEGPAVEVVGEEES